MRSVVLLLLLCLRRHRVGVAFDEFAGHPPDAARTAELDLGLWASSGRSISEPHATIRVDRKHTVFRVPGVGHRGASTYRTSVRKGDVW